MLAAKELTTIKPGVYDISIEQYHAGEGISRSGLKEYKRSPLHYCYKYVEGNQDKKNVEVITQRDALEFGNALHTFILEPHKFPGEYLVIDKISRNTIKGKNLFNEKLKEAAGRMLISSDAYEVINKMSDSIRAHPDAPALIKGASYEKSIYWNDPGSGLLCKARPDIWHHNFVADLKTATDGSPDAFSRDIYKYGYHLQAAMIHLGIKAIYDTEVTSFLFIVAEKQPPFAVAVYSLDKDDLANGIAEVQMLLLDMRDNYEDGHWPGYLSTCVSMPAFAKREEAI